MQLICPICGRQFQRRGTRKLGCRLVCCSRKCKARSQISRRIKGFNLKPKRGKVQICPTCGKTFQHPPSRVAKYCSQKCRAADRSSFNQIRGHHHYNWKGGITPASVTMRNSPEAKAWTRAVFKRDNFTCRACHKGGSLEAHHIYPWAEFPSLRFEVSNGITLCSGCHSFIHMYGRIVTKHINQIIKEYDDSDNPCSLIGGPLVF